MEIYIEFIICALQICRNGRRILKCTMRARTIGRGRKLGDAAVVQLE